MKHKLIKHTVELTEGDIINGTKSDCESCPIALALARTFKKTVTVNLFRWRFESNPLSSYALPDAVTKFIYRFDNDLPTMPFSFEVEVRE